jgi:hypothetical protein
MDTVACLAQMQRPTDTATLGHVADKQAAAAACQNFTDAVPKGIVS